MRQLKTVIQEKDKTIEELERKVDELEQYRRMDDWVGAAVVRTHRSYARVTSGDREGEEAPSGESHSLEQQVMKFFTAKTSPEMIKIL